MDITNINLAACPLQYLSIGYVGETGARPVAFDFSAWATEYGAGVLQLLLQRPGDANPYPVVLDIDGTTATWTPDATATEKTGQGQAQLIYTVGGVVVKNAIFRVLIAPSLGAAGNPPEPYEDWLERLLTIAAEAQQSAIDAAGSAEAAGTSAELAAAAKTAAETAQTGAEAAKTGAEAAEQTAQQAAALARAKAAEAAEAGRIAGDNADYAQHQSTMAADSAEAAYESAERAEQSAEDAQAAASAAQTAARAAAESASAASGSAADAAATVTEVETKGAEQITAINQAGTTQIAAVDAAGAAQVQAVEDKGEEVLESIPEDYTELISDVDDLKSALYDPRTGLDQKAGLLRDTAEGAVASFVPDATIDNLLGLTVGIEPVQEGSGDPSPENVRPISGWMGCNVMRTGKNLFDIDSANIVKGSITPSGEDQTINTRTRTQNYLPFKGGTYTISSDGTFEIYTVNFYDKDKTFISRDSTVQAVQITFTAPEQTRYIRIAFRYANNADMPVSVVKNVMLVTGSTASTYEPYIGTTIPITFPTEAGTVYGGTLDVGAGTLVVHMASDDLGNFAWKASSISAGTGGAFETAETITPGKAPSEIGNIMSSKYKTLTTAEVYARQTGVSVTDRGKIKIFDPAIAELTIPEVKAALSGTQLVYELKTPITITLDPVTISTISGQTNNVWADAGDVAVTFAADVKTYIDQKIAAAVAAMS